MSGKRSRNKGASFERLIANHMKTVFPSARRGVGQYQSAGNGADVEGTDYWIECKHGKQPNIRAAYEQARAARKENKDDRPILVVTRKDRSPIMATVEIQDFIRLLFRANFPGIPIDDEDFDLHHRGLTSETEIKSYLDRIYEQLKQSKPERK